MSHLRFITGGESHGVALTAILDGMPAGLRISRGEIDAQLARRQQGYGRGGRMKIETDRVVVLSGLRFGETLGAPITLQVVNRDFANWTGRMDPFGAPSGARVTAVRPGHADLAGVLKYDRHDARDILERSSARETTMRVAVGAVGSGVEANVRQILAVYGISYDDIDAQYLSFAEGASALKDGNVDVAVLTAGYPTASVQDIAAQNPVRLLPVEEEIADALIAQYPFYTKTVIPAGTYVGFNEPVPSVAVMAMLVAGPTVNEELGYKVTKAIFSHLDRLQAAHAVGKQITRDSVKAGMSLPMNEGAEKYFNEK